LPNSVSTDFQQLKATAVSSGGGSRAGGVAQQFDPPLLRGQLLEVIVAKTLTDGVWLESRNMMFRANLPVGGLREGERLLLRVLDPDSSPPKLKLITDAELPNSSLAGVSTFLRSLLFRHQQLNPTKHFITDFLNQGDGDRVFHKELEGLIDVLIRNKSSDDELDYAWIKKNLKLINEDANYSRLQLNKFMEKITSYLSSTKIAPYSYANKIINLNNDFQNVVDALKEWRKVPDFIDGKWVKEKLQLSGLFMESSDKKRPLSQFDLKALLVAMLKLEEPSDKVTLKMAIDGITSSQVKALDGLIQNNLQYNFLLPFLGEGWIEARISRDEEQISREQWQIYLRHQSQQMGDFSAEILLYKKTVSILFQSDQPWMIDLIKENYSELEQGITAIGLSVQQISVAQMVSHKPNFYKQHEQQAIFDLRV